MTVSPEVRTKTRLCQLVMPITPQAPRLPILIGSLVARFVAGSIS
jgi:hypothetical protein